VVGIGAVATDDKRAIDGVIVFLYKSCIGTAIGGKAALQGGSGVNVLPLLFSQHHPHQSAESPAEHTGLTQTDSAEKLKMKDALSNVLTNV